jgi:hypothetical protein
VAVEYCSTAIKTRGGIVCLSALDNLLSEPLSMLAPQCRDKARGELWSGKCGGVDTRPAVKVHQTTWNGRGEECKRYDLELSNIKGARNSWQEEGWHVHFLNRSAVKRSCIDPLSCQTNNSYCLAGLFVATITSKTSECGPFSPPRHFKRHDCTNSPTKIAMRKGLVMNFIMASHSDDKNSILSSLPTSCLKTKVHP